MINKKNELNQKREIFNKIGLTFYTNEITNTASETEQDENLSPSPGEGPGKLFKKTVTQEDILDFGSIEELQSNLFKILGTTD